MLIDVGTEETPIAPAPGSEELAVLKRVSSVCGVCVVTRVIRGPIHAVVFDE